jgi:hypothetical protein
MDGPAFITPRLETLPVVRSGSINTPPLEMFDPVALFAREGWNVGRL